MLGSPLLHHAVEFFLDVHLDDRVERQRHALSVLRCSTEIVLNFDDSQSRIEH